MSLAVLPQAVLLLMVCAKQITKFTSFRAEEIPLKGYLICKARLGILKKKPTSSYPSICTLCVEVCFKNKIANS